MSYTLGHFSIHHSSGDFYDEITGEWYNKLPLDTQIEILEKYYPIGHTFHWKQPDSVRPGSVVDYKKYTCMVTGHVKTQGSGGSEWYILNVRNMTSDTISIRADREYEQVHPGFFRPCSWYERGIKLKELGI